jgi:hypothetical protein
MSKQTAWRGLWIILCCLCASGCDPVRTTVQSVTLRVLDADSGQPVADAVVMLKHVGAQSDWLPGVTDKDGKAEIEFKVTALDRTRGSTPPPERNWILNRPGQIKVRRDQGPQEEFNLVVKPDATVKGKSYTVEIIEIQEPRYVPTR